MTSTDVQEAARRAHALRTQLDVVVCQFRDGEPIDPAEYERVVNALCKALLALERAEAA
jgi:hypothetical protein